MPLFRNSPTYISIDQYLFSRMMAQTTQTHARMCLFWDFLHTAPKSNLGGQKSKKQFWGVNKFSDKLAKSKNVHIIKTTASIPTKFYMVIKTTKCPSWMVSTHALQIHDGGRPPSWKKSKWQTYLGRGLTDFDEIWHAGAVRTLWTVSTVKNLKFQKFKTVCSMTRSKAKVTSSWKSENRPFSKAISSPIYNGDWQMTTDS